MKIKFKQSIYVLELDLTVNANDVHEVSDVIGQSLIYADYAEIETPVEKKAKNTKVTEDKVGDV